MNPAIRPHSPRARPWILVNMAMTADGKIAPATRRGAPFGSPRDQHHLYALRATADAVMAGARTVDQEVVTLGPGDRFRKIRIRRGLREFNLRIIASRSGSVRPDAEIFKHRFSPILILTTQRASPGRLAQLRQLADVWVCGRTEIDWRATLKKLRRRFGVRRLLCEGGGELNSALFRGGLVDELHLTLCPLIFGGRSAPTIADGIAFPSLAQAARLTLTSCRRVGKEFFLVFRRANRQSPRPSGAKIKNGVRP